MENSSEAPRKSGFTIEFAEFLDNVGKEVSTALAITQDPELREILETILRLDNAIATFFLRIREIIKLKTRDRGIQFVVDYFFKNFSIISENMRASRIILNYVAKKLDWLKQHSVRIIESLKTLYAHLLSMEIDCEELYRAMFGKTLNFDFGLGPKEGMFDVREVVTLERAYSILELSVPATREQVKAAFRKKAKTLHPDLNPDADREEFMIVEQAYKILLAEIRT
jgi:hypothetical protein